MAKLFSLEGKSLKLDTASDIESHIEPLRNSNDVEEVRLQGNTLGVGACEALAKVLETKQTIKVGTLATAHALHVLTKNPYRSRTSPTSSLRACSPRSQRHFLIFSLHY